MNKKIFHDEKKNLSSYLNIKNKEKTDQNFIQSNSFL